MLKDLYTVKLPPTYLFLPQPYKNDWSCLDFRLFYDHDLVFGYMEIL